MGTSPYICCPDDCSVFSDDFNRSQIGCKWEVRDGSWSTVELPSSETVLKESGNAGALIIAQRAVPNMSFKVGVDSPSDVLAGAKYRVIVNYVDDDNYHFAEFSFPTGWLTIRLAKRYKGSESTLLSRTWEGDMTGSPQHFGVCFSEKIFAAFQEYAPFAAWTPDPTPIPGGYLAGLGNGAGVAIDFDDFHLLEHYDTNPDCDRCVCRCDDQTPLPMQLKATLTFNKGLAPCDPLEITLTAVPNDEYCEYETECWHGTGIMDCSDCPLDPKTIEFHVTFDCTCGTDSTKHFSVDVKSAPGGDEAECEVSPGDVSCDPIYIPFLFTGYVTGGYCSGEAPYTADLLVEVTE